MATLRDVAERAGVSQSTASFVLNNRRISNISDETRKKVRSVAADLGYVPNAIARALATGKTGLIGLWIRSLQSTYYSRFVYDIDRVITDNGYKLTITRNPGMPPNEPDYQDFPTTSTDAIIAVDIPKSVERFCRLHPSTPIIQVGSDFTRAADYVVVEMRSATEEAVRHLYQLGRRRIAYLVDSPSATFGDDERLRTYRETLAKLKLDPRLLLSSGQTHREARFAMRQGLQENKMIDAVICYNDDMAVAACRAIHECGLRIPDDVAVVGCDDVPLAAHMIPSLSTIVHPLGAVCDKAWEILSKRIANPDCEAQHIELSATFVARESSLGTERKERTLTHSGSESTIGDR